MESIPLFQELMPLLTSHYLLGAILFVCDGYLFVCDECIALAAMPNDKEIPNNIPMIRSNLT